MSTTAMRTCAEHGAYVAFLNEKGSYTGCTQCAGIGRSRVGGASTELVENSMMLRSGVPEGIAGASFESFHPIIGKQKSMLGFVVGIAEQWRNGNFKACGQIALLGKNGAGKTHIAVSMLRRVAECMDARYLDASLGLPSPTYDSGLLVIDNLFYCGETPDQGKAAMLSELLYYRAVNHLPTILVSEQSKDQFCGNLSPRTLQWMRVRRTQIVNFNWDVETHLVG